MRIAARLGQFWISLRSSLWFIPALIVLGCVGLAIGLIGAEPFVADELLGRWPRLFGAGAEGSRSLLGSVASSMVTVAGVVFSITVVAITLAASQYSSRVLRNFMRDRANQAVLGIFVGIFAYCLIVVRTIRGGSDAFVPSLAVFGGLCLALLGIIVLIFFIHHITLSVQAAQILAAVCQDTLAAIDARYPERGGPSITDAEESPALLAGWHPVTAERSGYIQQIDIDALTELGEKLQAVIRLEKGIGDFLIEGLPVLLISSKTPPDDAQVKLLRRAFSVGRQRTVDQDPGFGIRQIVDIALKGLSPGINDTTTAVMCLDYLTLILLRLGQRRIGCRHLDRSGNLRVLACGPTYECLLDESLDQIRQNAGGNVAVLDGLNRCLETLADQLPVMPHLSLLADRALAVEEMIGRTVHSPLDRRRLAVQSSRLMTRLGISSTEVGESLRPGSGGYI